MAGRDHAQEPITLDCGEKAAAQPAKLRHGITTARNAFMSNGADEKAMASLIDRSLDELCINTIRTLSMDAVQQAEFRPPRHTDGLGAGDLHAVAAFPAV